MFSVQRKPQLVEGFPQLPIENYCDPDIYALELERIFRNSPIYVGHSMMVPQPGDWRGLAHEEQARILVHNATGIELLSNICRHRQALMLGDFSNGSPGECRGTLAGAGNRITCPLHAWVYNNRGKLVSAPKFPVHPCQNLERFPISNVGGFLFEGPHHARAELENLLAAPECDFSGYALDHVELHDCACNWKTFIEIYNDDYHIAAFHPGLKRYVCSDDLSWEYGRAFNVQRISASSNLHQSGTETYRQWQEQLLDYLGKPPDFGAVWATYYPTLMIEVFPQALVLSTVYPLAIDRTMNVVEFYYPQELLRTHPGLAAAHRAAYMETAYEDDEIAERTDAGRRALYRRGVTDIGPYQAPLEDGMRHFHTWYRSVMS
ncbi:aromatic ring-hydroxylating oxygenase subunit alpha [Azomonas macrocytogenes]|uniref:Phenylpropionate dioxygenase-like ring-hydroxylating dioxygenase large terminal subunit n=1 Tax=Azomonas macrocytogenes TaxID=69962 RepID=A0A839T107_AZOMA|nr:aromatic ring-hydroxylating dioxygenase subunit alpha [Azomonas macrocytogenes]MBB3103072.1 phenylpropionate dioxygenase-like ring-hydroxylating dioxygenase large terminal subunit [Azomonas macrocytogenes]